MARCVTFGHRVSLRAGDLYSSPPHPNHHPLQTQGEGTGGPLPLGGGAAEIRASRHSPEDEGVKAAASRMKSLTTATADRRCCGDAADPRLMCATHHTHYVLKKWSPHLPETVRRMSVSDSGSLKATGST